MSAFSLLKKYVIEKSCTKLKFTLILKEFRFVQRVVGVQRAKPLVALRRERNSLN